MAISLMPNKIAIASSIGVVFMTRAWFRESLPCLMLVFAKKGSGLFKPIFGKQSSWQNIDGRSNKYIVQ